MATVISISSDEEEEQSEFPENRRKKRKIQLNTSVICLDDEDKDDKSINVPQEDIIIESDDDLFCDPTQKLNAKSRIINNNKSSSENECESIKDTTIGTSDLKTDKISGQLQDIKNDNLSINNEIAAEGSNNKDVGEMFNNCKEMQIFINICLTQLHNKSTKFLFKSKIPICKKLFDKVGDEYIQSQCFKSLLEEKIESSKKSSLLAISSFNDVYLNLKAEAHKNTENVEITDKNERIISKLEHALRKIQKVVTKLEKAEVNFDDEEDSSYMKLQRYRERAVKIYDKLCKYKKEDAHADNILYNRLDFSGSAYPEFNHAINKKFKNNFAFPTYYDMERCLKKTLKDKNMNLSENRLQQEARQCFKKLGNLLQKRRKLDLLNVHRHYIETNDDPACDNPELDSKLKYNFKEASSKINEICEKYTKLQENGDDPKLSSDSDDSKKASTDDADE